VSCANCQVTLWSDYCVRLDPSVEDRKRTVTERSHTIFHVWVSTFSWCFPFLSFTLINPDPSHDIPLRAHDTNSHPTTTGFHENWLPLKRQNTIYRAVVANLISAIGHRCQTPIWHLLRLHPGWGLQVSQPVHDFSRCLWCTEEDCTHAK
jgi:hypothetical protein